MPKRTDEQLQALCQKTLSEPFQQFCDLKLVTLKEGEAITRFVIGDNTATGQGWLHGGILYGLLDASSYLAIIPMLDETQHAVSHDVHFSIMRRTERGMEVTIKTQVLRKGERVAFIQAEAYAESGGKNKLIATGNVTKSIINLPTDSGQ